MSTGRTIRTQLLAVGLLHALLTACGVPTGPQAGDGPVVDPMPAELTTGELSIQASVVHTHALLPTIAERYGVPRKHDTFMLLVRTAHPDGTSPSPSARVRDLRGVWREVAMAPVSAATGTEHRGTFRLQPPDTALIEVQVPSGSGNHATLRFVREIKRV